MDELIVQPIGGFAGAGAPGHVRSEGHLSMASLSPADRAMIEALFSRPQGAAGNFGYRITRRSAGGDKTVDASPDAVPPALIASIKSVLE